MCLLYLDKYQLRSEMMESFDLAELDLRLHGGGLLDRVGDALALKLNREALQGRPKVCKGAKSATNVYAYEYTFCRRAIIATLSRRSTWTPLSPTIGSQPNLTPLS